MRLGRAPQTSTARLPLVTDNAQTALMAGSRQNPFAFAWTAQGKGVVAAYHKPVFFFLKQVKSQSSVTRISFYAGAYVLQPSMSARARASASRCDIGRVLLNRDW